MADATRSTTSAPPPEDMHWAVSYLREDLQDIRSETRDLHKRIDNTGHELRQRIDDTTRELRERIDEVSTVAAGERRELRQHIEALSTHLDSHFRWTMGGMIGIASLIVAMIKL